MALTTKLTIILLIIDLLTHHCQLTTPLFNYNKPEINQSNYELLLYFAGAHETIMQITYQIRVMGRKTFMRSLSNLIINQIIRTLSII